MNVLKSLLAVLFGPAWMSSLGGYIAAMVASSVVYFQGEDPTKPGWFLLSIGLAALGRALPWPQKSAAKPPELVNKP